MADDGPRITTKNGLWTPDEVAETTVRTVHGKCERCTGIDWCDSHESLWPEHMEYCFRAMDWHAVARLAVLIDRGGVDV